MMNGSDNAFFFFWIDLDARGTLAQPAPTQAGKLKLKQELGLNW
jgi:hypothetical protein